MAANTQPIFPISPKVSGGKVITADTSYENPVTNPVTLFTAGENGARIDQIKARALGDNVATVLRLFVYDGASYMLAHESGLPESTAANGETGSDIDILRDTGYEAVPPVPYLPAGYSLVGTVGTTVASGWMVMVFGGEY